MKVRLSTFDNSWYRPGNPLKRILWYAFNRVFFMTSIPYPSALKAALLRIFGARVGRGSVIKPRVSIKYPWFLEVGNHVWIGEGVWIDNLTKVTIASNVCLSQGAMLLCGNHDYTKSTFNLMASPISLEAGVWIGAKAIVCPGVCCKSHAILTVGSVTANDLEAFGIYRGNPAVKIRDRKMDD